jgi:hypothetical protein
MRKFTLRSPRDIRHASNLSRPRHARTSFRLRESLSGEPGTLPYRVRTKHAPSVASETA